MSHAFLSTATAISLFALGVQQIFYPAVSFSTIGPFQPFFDGGFDKATPAQLALLKFMGSFMIIIALMTTQVWWDATNRQLPALGFLLGAINFAYTTFSADGGFVLRVTYVYAAVLFMGFVHMAFLSNKIKLVDVINAERAERAAKKKSS
jgi:hypothetical protein